MAFHRLLFLAAGAIAAIAVLDVSFRDAPVLETNSQYMDGPIKVAVIA